MTVSPPTPIINAILALLREKAPPGLKPIVAGRSIPPGLHLQVLHVEGLISLDVTPDIAAAICANTVAIKQLACMEKLFNPPAGSHNISALDIFALQRQVALFKEVAHLYAPHVQERANTLLRHLGFSPTPPLLEYVDGTIQELPPTELTARYKLRFCDHVRVHPTIADRFEKRIFEAHAKSAKGFPPIIADIPLQDPRLAIGQTSTGAAVFAAEDIPAKTVLGMYAGRHIPAIDDPKGAKAREEWKLDLESGEHLMQVVDGSIGARKEGNFLSRISDGPPNAILSAANPLAYPQIASTVVTIAEIPRGAQVLIDYGCLHPVKFLPTYTQLAPIVGPLCPDSPLDSIEGRHLKYLLQTPAVLWKQFGEGTLDLAALIQQIAKRADSPLLTPLRLQGTLSLLPLIEALPPEQRKPFTDELWRRAIPNLSTSLTWALIHCDRLVKLASDPDFEDNLPSLRDPSDEECQTFADGKALKLLRNEPRAGAG